MLPEEQLGHLLTKLGLKLAIAETTTGGLISSSLVNVPGSSKYFAGGIVAYSHQMKSELLQVSFRILDHHGAVSKETAIAMAKNICKITGADIGLAETGIAGPILGQSPKPLGTAFIAVSFGKDVYCEEELFKGNRSAIRNAIAETALTLLIKYLTDLDQ